LTAGAFLISSFALTGIPVFSGWWSEYHLFTVVAELGRPDVAIVSILTSALTLAFTLKAFNLTFFGSRGAASQGAKEHWLSGLAAILAILSILVGLFPDSVMPTIYSLAGGLVR
jgi:formate hydrogenlyase subunit 3/multisubunit Na+/H+ antiporter MnhD subunit